MVKENTIDRFCCCCIFFCFHDQERQQWDSALNSRSEFTQYTTCYVCCHTFKNTMWNAKGQTAFGQLSYWIIVQPRLRESMILSKSHWAVNKWSITFWTPNNANFHIWTAILDTLCWLNHCMQIQKQWYFYAKSRLRIYSHNINSSNSILQMF